MPIVTIKPQTRAPDEQLMQRLVDEWQGKGTEPRPTIVHEEDEQGVVVHVYVVWTEWGDLDQQARSELITAAYWKVFEEKGLALTVAMGLTPEEAKRMGVRTA
jgi:hypothetical protein